MTALFLDHSDARTIAEELERVRVLVRKAQRFTTKAESVFGQEAHRALAAAEQVLDHRLSQLGGAR